MFLNSIHHSWIRSCNLYNQYTGTLTHWGRVTHIYVGNLTIIGSDNGLSPSRHQAIIWTSAGILLIGPLGTNFSEILIGIQTFSFKKMHLKMASAKLRPFCPGLNMLNTHMGWRWRFIIYLHYTTNLHGNVNSIHMYIWCMQLRFTWW